jgi:hypothetical protein
MAFSPNLFLSNINGKGGPARTNRFEVILPIPPYIGESIGNSVIEKILNLSDWCAVAVSVAVHIEKAMSLSGCCSSVVPVTVLTRIFEK